MHLAFYLANLWRHLTGMPDRCQVVRPTTYLSCVELDRRQSANNTSGSTIVDRTVTRRMAIANWTCVSWVAYAAGTIVVNVTWIEREFNACQTHRSMYTSIFNRLHAIARYWSEIATFSYPLAFNAPVRSSPWENRGKCYTDWKRIQFLLNA